MAEHQIQAAFVTGGAGFIGSNFIRFLLDQRPEAAVVNYDALTYAGNLESTADCESNARYTFVKGDICDGEKVRRLLDEHRIDTGIGKIGIGHDRVRKAAPRRIVGQTLQPGGLLDGIGYRRLQMDRFHQIDTGSVGQEIL